MSIIPFTYEGRELRFLTDENGEPEVVAADLAQALGHRDAANMCRAIDGDERGTHLVSTPSGDQEMTVLTEAGMYQAILQRQTGRMVDTGQRAAVKAFQRWVTHEVIPSIRKRGVYATEDMTERMLADPDVMIRALTELKAERAKRAQLEAQAETDRPKVLFADAVSTAHTSVLVGDLAKILKGNGIDIGANRLFKILRDKGYLISRKGTDWNMPTQRSMELGLFKVKETSVVHSDGHTTISKTPKVTGKGQTYFVDRFLSGRINDDEAVA